MTLSVRGGSGDQTPASPPANSPQATQPTTTATTNPDTQTAEQKDEQTEESTGAGEEVDLLLPNGEPVFPLAELSKLDEMINRARWVVPVLPKGELEVLLEASIKLCHAGLDTKSEECQRFFKDGLTISFHKILNDEAVNGWKYEIHRCILKNTEKLIELCVTKLSQDWFPLLELLALAFNPMSRFNIYNGARPSESCSQGTPTVDSITIYAKAPDARSPKGWLVDLVNKFGSLDGFSILRDRICSQDNLGVPLLSALLKPFGSCAEVLTSQTVEKYFLPIIDFVPGFLDGLSDEELKKEAKNEAKNDALSSIIKALKSLAARITSKEDLPRQLETFRLKMILRLLQISSFNGKMNALNEINKVISSVSYYAHRHTTTEEEEWLTAERMAEWIHSNEVLSIVLKDNLHQPQYVEKLEKIIRFVIKEKALSLEDLDSIWSAQIGKHDAIVKNIHDLLAKLAWDFSAEQLDHLFSCFQESWACASKKQREKLLELIRRLAEDDKEGVMAHKVLGLLWSLAHSDDVPTDIMDLALSAHIKILDYSCSQDRDSQKTQWIDRCVEELRNDSWVLPALKHIKEICMLFYEAPQNYSHMQRNPHVFYRHEVINQLQLTHSLVTLVADNLAKYMEKVGDMLAGKKDLEDVNEFTPDGRYNHSHQVQERLTFLRFLLKDGQLWLCEPQAKLIWQCLAEKAVFPSDRECCFKWFSKLMGDEPDLDPEISLSFFEGNVLKLDPALLTENGIRCFERFFRGVNIKERKLVAKRRSYLIEDLDLVGVNYLWQVVLHSSDEIATRAIELIKETYTNLGPSLRANQVEIHDKFIQTCTGRIQESAKLFTTAAPHEEADHRIEVSGVNLLKEATKVVRCLTVLKEYVAECDDDHMEERAILPHGRSCRGRHVSLIVRFPSHGRQGEEFEIWSHMNESLASVRRHILSRIKVSAQATKVDLYVNGELLCPSDDRRLVFQVPLRDRTLITAKVGPINSSMPSSPDSSSESSTGSTPATLDGPNLEAENCLPGVILSKRHSFLKYLVHLADLGIENNISELRDIVRQLLDLIPSDTDTVENIKTICHDHAENGAKAASKTLETIFFINSPMQALYNLELAYALLMPAGSLTQETTFEFQVDFLKSGGIPCVISMLTNTEFLSKADVIIKRAAFNSLLKHSKLLFTVIGHAQVTVVAEAINPTDPPSTAQPLAPFSASVHNAAVILQQALHYIPNPNTECMLKNVAVRLARKMGKAATGHIPDLSVIKAVQRLAWVSAAGVLNLLDATHEDIHKSYEKPSGKNLENDDVLVAKEALEVLTVCLALCPAAIDSLSKDKSWQCFVIDLLILCPNRAVRFSAAEQFFLMATRCSPGHRPTVFFITLLFTVLMNTVKEHPSSAHDYFSMLCRLLNHAFFAHCPLPTAEVLLRNEISWLKKTKESVLATEEGVSPVDEALLEGHLGITRELLLFQSPQSKLSIGSQTGGANLIKELVEDFIFPASKIVLEASNGNSDVWNRRVSPVCSSPPTLVAGFDLLVALCTGCVDNLRLLADILTDMYYSDICPVTEWEHLPPIGPRPFKGYVGLKNAGATCYMNSVIQQLFMIPELRKGILLVEGAVSDDDEEIVGELEEKSESESTVDTGYQSEESRDNEKESGGGGEGRDKAQEQKKYQISVLRQIQYIFGHLAQSQLQFHIPKGFWKTFKFLGEPVNLREQHDALEFFNNLVDNLDEGLKALGHDPIFSKILGGAFADQKICKGCPHRYSREAPFIALNVDIRNHQSLHDSMEQFVKGDLLEGANAYYCEKCDKKVDTVKRMCISKLPRIMAIQLKRFDYDWERECAVKFNDYFEFPRDIDMAPYTEMGLAKAEGEISPELVTDSEREEVQPQASLSTHYRLTGILVHSGQASGGHYYCYILQRSSSDESSRWYKFDDGEVSECKMEDDEEIKTQCFGGEYMGEVFDHMLKRMSYRRQKRWWNAYILFYERDVIDVNKSSEAVQALKMPTGIERAVRKQNVHFLHNRTQFSPEYFQFMRKLVTTNAALENAPDLEELAMISIKLVSRFLFTTGFHTKKTVRGPANEWYDAVSILLRQTPAVRTWFAQEVLFAHPDRFSEYLLESPTAEVRNAFAKILVFLAHFSRQDGPCGSLPGLPESELDNKATLSDHILKAVLGLLKKEVPEHGRHVQQYFQFFLMYAALGAPEKTQLLSLGVPATFMLVAIDEGPGPPLRYAELGKLYNVVAQLVRSCDVSARMQSSMGSPPLPNPYGEGQPLMELQADVSDTLFNKFIYLKKVIEDTTSSEETLKLLRFCCWENPHFSRAVLSELLWQVAYSYTYELRPYFDLLLQMLLLQDSWQSHRIHNTLRGIPDDKDGLFEIIQRSKNHYQKRAYQCIKFMVALFSGCHMAHQILLGSPDLKRKWTWGMEWLGDELDRRPYAGGASYTYNNWSPPAQSNETSNGYFLERSHSARLTLAKACELCPEEEQEEEEGEVEADNGVSPDESGDPPPTTEGIDPITPPRSDPETGPETGPEDPPAPEDPPSPKEKSAKEL